MKNKDWKYFETVWDIISFMEGIVMYVLFLFHVFFEKNSILSLTFLLLSFLLICLPFFDIKCKWEMGVDKNGYKH